MHRITKITFFGVRLGVIALVVYWTIIFLGTHLPKVPDPARVLNDKVMHFSAYFGLTILLCYVGRSDNLYRRFSLVALIAAAYGIFDELTQTLVPGRYAELYDWLADLGGIATAIAIYALLRPLFHQRPEPVPQPETDS